MGNMKKRLLKTIQGFYRFTDGILWLAYVMLTVNLLVVFVDVFGRYFINRPLPGSYELVEQTIIIVNGVAIMYAAIRKGHVVVDLLFARFSARARQIMEKVFSSLGFVIWGVFAYEVCLEAADALKTMQTTLTLNIILSPFLIILAATILLASLASLIDIFYPLHNAGENNKGAE